MRVRVLVLMVVVVVVVVGVVVVGALTRVRYCWLTVLPWHWRCARLRSGETFASCSFSAEACRAAAGDVELASSVYAEK